MGRKISWHQLKLNSYRVGIAYLKARSRPHHVIRGVCFSLTAHSQHCQFSF